MVRLIAIIIIILCISISIVLEKTKRKANIVIVTFSVIVIVLCGLTILFVSLLGEPIITEEDGFYRFKSQYESVISAVIKDNIQGEYVLPIHKKNLSNRGKVFITRYDNDLTVYFIGNTDFIDPGEIHDSIIYTSTDKEPIIKDIRFEDMFFVVNNIKRLERNWYLVH